MTGFWRLSIIWGVRSVMVKSCREIAKDIEDLKDNLKQNKLFKKSSEYDSERKKCDSNNVNEMCSGCYCWKIMKEYNL
jgi:hypothetical protein